MINHMCYNNFIRTFEEQIEEAERHGHGREALSAMAATMQHHLSVDMRERIYPYGSSLELIMRACMAALAEGNLNAPPNDPGQASYIKNKLDNGVVGLFHDIGIHRT